MAKPFLGGWAAHAKEMKKCSGSNAGGVFKVRRNINIQVKELHLRICRVDPAAELGNLRLNRRLFEQKLMKIDLPQT